MKLYLQEGFDYKLHETIYDNGIMYDDLDRRHRQWISLGKFGRMRKVSSWIGSMEMDFSLLMPLSCESTHATLAAPTA